ncbi:MAG: WXG100 family type VII secretion target [Candidatus Ventricola sp.]
MPLIKVTISELQGAANKVSQANSNFRDAAAALKAAADALADTWEGGAHDAFVQEQDQINKWYDTMAEVVDGFVSSMTQAAADYEATDQAGAQIVRRN